MTLSIYLYSTRESSRNEHLLQLSLPAFLDEYTMME